MNIFVGSLPFKLEEVELKELFESFGEVSSARIITDRETGRSKGFGFVEMPDDEAALNAINEVNGTQLYGRAIVVNQAEERKERPAGGGGYNRGGGGGSRGGFSRNGGGFKR
jgi:RNA recognition motif-containing protein